jgi:hypothetical protein
MQLEENAGLAAFRAEAADLVLLASGRLLERDISGDDNRRFAAMLLEAVPQAEGSDA